MEIALFLIIGTTALFIGAELLVKGAGSFAWRCGIPVVVIGVLVVGYGTGMPELIVTIQAALAQKGDIALGNVIGSNLANIGLVLAVSTMIIPIQNHSPLIRSDAAFMLGATVILALFTLFSETIQRWQGVCLLATLGVYTLWSINQGRKEKVLKEEFETEHIPYHSRSIVLDLILVIGGLAILISGGALFLKGAITTAQTFGISDAIIGLTVVAFGTSLPEFATSILAMIRSHRDIAIGNVVGSNIFNILAIIGIASVIQPLQLSGIAWSDMAYLNVMTLFLFIRIFWDLPLSRPIGCAMLASYILYIVSLVNVHVG